MTLTLNTLSTKRRHAPAQGKVATHSRRRSQAEARTDRLPGLARVTIQFCELANYRPVAESLAEAIDREFLGFPVEIDLHPSRGGVYEVTVNGRLVFSKRATTRLPDPDEIFYHVRAALPARRVDPSPSLT